jgi:3-deoxy-7-phosphoheptulonate synthase
MAIIAGPCAIENPKQVFSVAEAVAKSGAKFFRGGAFKPRTSPYAFQGMGEDGLKILAEVRDQFDLNIVTEAMDEHGVDLVEKYGDCIQIGARNMQNFSLLKYVGQTRKPVLAETRLSATLDELLLAAEYIMAEGNYDVILCERGIRTLPAITPATLWIYQSFRRFTTFRICRSSLIRRTEPAEIIWSIRWRAPELQSALTV